ncbi:hypothetical protein MRX96_001162 [Rhipicephalus microplus]
MRLPVAMGDGGDVECCCQATATASRQLLRLPAAHSVLRSQGKWRRPALLSLVLWALRDGDFQEAEKGHRYGPQSKLCECVLPPTYSSPISSFSTTPYP